MFKSRHKAANRSTKPSKPSAQHAKRKKLHALRQSSNSTSTTAASRSTVATAAAPPRPNTPQPLTRPSSTPLNNNSRRLLSSKPHNQPLSLNYQHRQHDRRLQPQFSSNVKLKNSLKLTRPNKFHPFHLPIRQMATLGFPNNKNNDQNKPQDQTQDEDDNDDNDNVDGQYDNIRRGNDVNFVYISPKQLDRHFDAQFERQEKFSEEQEEGGLYHQELSPDSPLYRYHELHPAYYDPGEEPQESQESQESQEEESEQQRYDTDFGMKQNFNQKNLQNLDQNQIFDNNQYQRGISNTDSRIINNYIEPIPHFTDFYNQPSTTLHHKLPPPPVPLPSELSKLSPYINLNKDNNNINNNNNNMKINPSVNQIDPKPIPYPSPPSPLSQSNHIPTASPSISRNRIHTLPYPETIENYAFESHSISTIKKNYPLYYQSNLPGLYPTTPFVLNQFHIGKNYLPQLLPLPPDRVGSFPPPEYSDNDNDDDDDDDNDDNNDGGIKFGLKFQKNKKKDDKDKKKKNQNDEKKKKLTRNVLGRVDDSALFDNAINHLEANGGSLHPHLELGNLYSYEQLEEVKKISNTPRNLAKLNKNVRIGLKIDPTTGKKSKSVRPSWFIDRISDDWGFIATENIQAGSILLRVPSALFIRSHGLVVPSNIDNWRSQEVLFQKRLDIIALSQSALHLIGDSSYLFKIHEELDKMELEKKLGGLLSTIKHIKKNKKKKNENNDDGYNDDGDGVDPKLSRPPLPRPFTPDEAESHNIRMKRLKNRINHVKTKDTYYKHIFSNALFLLLLKSFGKDYQNNPFLNLLPTSFPLIDMANDPESAFYKTNIDNMVPISLDMYMNDVWLPSLERITLDTLPPRFFEILGTSLQTVEKFPPKTSIAALLFHFFKDSLQMDHPTQLVGHLTWAANVVHQNLVHTLPRDPKHPKPLASRFLYSPLNQGIIPLTELFRESEQPNCIMKSAHYEELTQDEQDRWLKRRDKERKSARDARDAMRNGQNPQNRYGTRLSSPLAGSGSKLVQEQAEARDSILRQAEASGGGGGNLLGRRDIENSQPKPKTHLDEIDKFDIFYATEADDPLTTDSEEWVEELEKELKDGKSIKIRGKIEDEDIKEAKYDLKRNQRAGARFGDRSIPKRGNLSRKFKRIPYNHDTAWIDLDTRDDLRSTGIDDTLENRIGNIAQEQRPGVFPHTFKNAMKKNRIGFGRKGFQNLVDTRPPERDYASFFYEVIAQRDILRGEEVTVNRYYTKMLEIPVITPQTEQNIQRLLQRTDNLRDLLRYSLCRVPQIVHEYHKQDYLYSPYSGEMATRHGVINNIQLKSKVLLLNPTNSTITRELTPSYNYLVPNFQSKFPTELKYDRFGKLDWDQDWSPEDDELHNQQQQQQQQGNLALLNPNSDLFLQNSSSSKKILKHRPIINIDLLSPRDRRLVKYTEDSFPYLNYDDAPLKYIVPSYYDDFNLNDLFARDIRFNAIQEAFSNIGITSKSTGLNGNNNNTNRIEVLGGMVNKHNQFEVGWLGPSHPNLEAFYRFQMAAGFMAPHPDKVREMITMGGNGSSNSSNSNNNDGNGGMNHYQQPLSDKFTWPFTPKTSKMFIMEQFKQRFNYVCDLAEANYRATYGISGKLLNQQQQQQQQQQGNGSTPPSSILNNINQTKEDIDTFLSKFHSSTPLSGDQWIKAFSTKLDNENELCKFIGLYQSSVRLAERLSTKQTFRHVVNAWEEILVNGTTSDGGIFLPSSKDDENNDRKFKNSPQHLPIDMAYTIMATYNQTALVSHLTKVFAGRLGLDRHHLQSTTELLSSSSSQKNNLTQEQKYKNLQLLEQRYPERVKQYREQHNGGLSLPPRWHVLDGLPLDTFNQQLQSGALSMGNRNSKQLPPARYRPFVPK